MPVHSLPETKERCRGTNTRYIRVLTRSSANQRTLQNLSNLLAPIVSTARFPISAMDPGGPRSGKGRPKVTHRKLVPRTSSPGTKLLRLSPSQAHQTSNVRDKWCLMTGTRKIGTANTRYHNQRTTVPLRQPETPIYGNLTTVSQCVKCNRSNAPGQDLISILDSITLPLAWQHRVRLAYDIEADLGNRDCYLENLSGQLTNEFSFLRWREADNVVFMFFTVVDLKLPSSRLMCIIHPAATGGERNRHVSTRICVTNIAHLPPLFKNAKRVLGLPSILALCRRKYNPTQSQPQQYISQSDLTIADGQE